jgi:hypothetical protein
MNVKERISQLEVAFQQNSKARDDSLETVKNTSRAMDQITGALQILRELEAEVTEKAKVVEKGNGVAEGVPEGGA